ncbi:MAG: hypothetical protein IKE43_12355 [Coriobacteriales bacterium]|nr:hypothetical protein [Coriobacteriales bacterium]
MPSQGHLRNDETFVIDKSDESDLKRKKQVFLQESHSTNALQLTMVSAHGIKENNHSWDIVTVVTQDDLFEA